MRSVPLRLLGLGLLAITARGCTCNGGGTATVPPILADCVEEGATVTLEMSVTGRRQATTVEAIDLTGRISNPSDSTITWTADEGSTTALVAGSTVTGTVGQPGADGSRPIRARETIQKGSLTGILTVTGSITGPPPPCTGSGTWNIPPALNGQWTIR